MSFGETIVRWAIIIGFALLAAVTGLAAVLLWTTDQPNQSGNPALLLGVALASAAVAFWLRRTLRHLKSKNVHTP